MHTPANHALLQQNTDSDKAGKGLIEYFSNGGGMGVVNQ